MLYGSINSAGNKRIAHENGMLMEVELSHKQFMQYDSGISSPTNRLDLINAEIEKRKHIFHSASGSP